MSKLASRQRLHWSLTVSVASHCRLSYPVILDSRSPRPIDRLLTEVSGTAEPCSETEWFTTEASRVSEVSTRTTLEYRLVFTTRTLTIHYRITLSALALPPTISREVPKVHLTLSRYLTPQREERIGLAKVPTKDTQSEVQVVESGLRNASRWTLEGHLLVEDHEDNVKSVSTCVGEVEVCYDVLCTSFLLEDH